VLSCVRVLRRKQQ